MTEKSKRLIITFNSTTEAIAFEKYFRESGLPGRIIPVPRKISASCGLCWRAEPEERNLIEKNAAAAKLTFAEIYELEL